MQNHSKLLLVGAAGLFLATAAQAQIDFDPPLHLPTGQRPSGVALGDFDGDGDLDLAVTTDSPDKVEIYTNLGAANFSGPVPIFLGAGVSAHSLIARDLDGDGDLDLAVTLKGIDQVRVLLNMGGTFVAAGSTAVGASEPRWMAAGDLDGDGDVDLVTANRKSDNVSVLLNSGGSFTLGGVFSTGAEPRGISLADTDGDGDLDVVVACHDDRTVRILLNQGSGNLVTGAVLFVGGQLRPDGVTATDLDGDGDPDIVAATSGNGFNFVTVFTNTGGTFAGPMSFATGGVDPADVGAADFDGDGVVDLITTQQDSNGLSALAGLGGNTFGAPALFSTGTRPDDLEFGDLDGNGTPDVVVANRDSNEVTLHLNRAAGGGGLGTNYCSSNPNSTGQTAALTASGSAMVASNNLTFVVSAMPQNKFGYLLMSATQDFVPLFGGTQGNLCLGQPLLRFAKFVQNSGTSGSISFSPDLTNLPQGTVIQPGETWNFQYWYRDVNGGSPTSNTSNGLAIDFQ